MGKYEYIIVDSNNEWLATLFDKKTAISEFRAWKKRYKEEKNDSTLYLYQAKELEQFEAEL